MADLKVSISSLDATLDLVDNLGDALANYINVILYDIQTMKDAINEKKNIFRREVDRINRRSGVLLSYDEPEANFSLLELLSIELNEYIEKIEQCDKLLLAADEIETEVRERLLWFSNSFNDAVGVSTRYVADYIASLQDIYGSELSSRTVHGKNRGGGYAVCFIDKTKYPQSAEHIQAAITAGYSPVLTLGRRRASERRKASLASFPVSPYYDRDEYPPAAFEEGGNGAHVCYMSASDNRGSGSSFSHQLRNIPDGTKVRFRVI